MDCSVGGGIDDQMDARDPVLDVSIVEDEIGFQGLAPEWDALIAEAGHPGCMGFAWAWAGWEHSQRGAGGALCIIVIRRAGRLVGLWPLVRFRRRLHRELRPLGWNEWDDMDLLVLPGPERMRVGLWLWETAQRCGDVLFIPFTRPSSLLTQVLNQRAVASTRDVFTTHIADVSAHRDFDRYLDTIICSRRRIARSRRQLAELGSVAIRVETETADKLRCLRWTLEQKMAWLQGKGLKDGSVGRTDFTAFLESLLTVDSAASPLRILSLYSNENLIATNIITLGSKDIFFNITTYDPIYSRFSPGSILHFYLLEWAHSLECNIDFRAGTVGYKLELCDVTAALNRHLVALRWAGLPWVAREWVRLTYLRVRGRYRRALGWIVSRWVKPWAMPMRSWLRKAVRAR